jgi:hypothetical protein
MTIPGFNADRTIDSPSVYYRSRGAPHRSGRSTEISAAFVHCHIEFHQPAPGETCYWHEWTGGSCGYLTSCDVGF